jgi:hypothetical protein
MFTKDLPQFLVGWGSFDEQHKKPDGFKTFILVDDYTMFDLHSKLTEHVVPRRDEVFTILSVWHNQAYGGPIYLKGGIVCPTVSQLPALFCLEHGKPTGTYILNATVETAADFILSQT